MVPASKCSATNLLNTFLSGTKWISLGKKPAQCRAYDFTWFHSAHWKGVIFYPHCPWDSQRRNTWQLLLCTSSIVTPLPKLPTLSFICIPVVIWGQRTPDSPPTTSADILRRSGGHRDQNFFRDLDVAQVPHWELAQTAPSLQNACPHLLASSAPPLTSISGWDHLQLR